MYYLYILLLLSVYDRIHLLGLLLTMVELNLLRHARREFSMPKLQYFLSF